MTDNIEMNTKKSFMRSFEKRLAAVRHSSPLEDRDRLWAIVRPAYDWALQKMNPRGLTRCINGTDTLRIDTRFRDIAETYEPEVWGRVMSSIKRGDCIVDVGAHVGLYAIAIARRAGKEGTVYAFEPDPDNFMGLQRNVRLNGVVSQVRSYQQAVGAFTGTTRFAAGRATESAVDESGPHTVEVVRLDDLFPESKVDVLKIDVEGYEAQVLEGASSLLADTKRRPRVLFVELHPFAWGKNGTTGAHVIEAVTRHGYQAFDSSGSKPPDTTKIGWMVGIEPARPGLGPEINSG
jgi:FkbM family methyltransferase